MSEFEQAVLTVLGVGGRSALKSGQCQVASSDREHAPPNYKNRVLRVFQKD